LSITCNSLGDDAEQIVLLSDISEFRSLQDLLAQQQQLSAMGEMVARMAHRSPDTVIDRNFVRLAT